jgi:hypothetical protein
MVKSIITALVLLMATTIANAAVYIEGYHKEDGAYVRPHWIAGYDYGIYNEWLTPEYLEAYGGGFDDEDEDEEEEACLYARAHQRKLNKRYCCCPSEAGRPHDTNFATMY